jgi:hypothetical protein
VWVGRDGFVFVADFGNSRVQVLTPRLAFCRSVGVGVLDRPQGVCATADVIVASDGTDNRVVSFRRCDGALLRVFSDAGELNHPVALCLTSRETRVVVASCWSHRVAVFTIAGDFVRHIGAGVLCCPLSVACSSWDEVVVSDGGNLRIRVFSDDGDLLHTFGNTLYLTIALRRHTLLAVAFGSVCLLFGDSGGWGSDLE